MIKASMDGVSAWFVGAMAEERGGFATVVTMPAIMV
jgi:hypothetical protein